MEILGIDIGGTGIKGAIVDVEKGVFVSERKRFKTPDGAKPNDVLEVMKTMIAAFDYKGKNIGCGFPASVKNGVVKTASNIDSSWIGTPINSYFSENLGYNFKVFNDVDAVGLAEMRYGAAKGKKGTIIVVAFGTGIGSALFRDGILLPNTELGHLYMKSGKISEKYAANSIREAKDLSYKKFGKRVSKYLNLLTKYFYPDLIIFGGGISKKWDKFEQYISVDVPIRPTALLNHSGIIGAASIFPFSSPK